MKKNVQESKIKALKPLFIIVAIITIGSLAGAYDIVIHKLFVRQFLQNFMAGFFLVFAGFKLLDVKGFAKGYQKYDLIAKVIPSYGLVYPFIELGLGIAYASGLNSNVLHTATLLLMTVSGIGVGMKVIKGEKFQCACLGTFINVPLTNITLVEDFGMALMAAVMLTI